MGEEHRQYERITHPFDIQYRIIGELMESWRDVKSLDLSGAGVRFLSEDPLEAGMELMVRLRLPTMNEALVIRGRIIWSRRLPADTVEVGVAFEQGTLEDAERIDQLVRFLRIK